MAVDLLGPASEQSTTVRPGRTNMRGAADTWFQDCSTPTAEDGTVYSADYFNDLLAQLRAVILGSGVVQDNIDDMLWRAIEVMAPRYAVDGGVANAIVITDVPPVPAYRAGLVVAIKVKYANTQAVTVSVDGITPLAAALAIDGSPLVGGELGAGYVHLFVMDDALAFRLLNPVPTFAPPVGRSISGSASAGTKTASWSGVQLEASAGINSPSYFGSNLTLNFNGATTGANGMDTGSMPSSADLSIYAIFNPTTRTWATLGVAGATSKGPFYTGSHMPAGYTASQLIWVGVTTGTNFFTWNQIDRTIYYAGAAAEIITGGFATTPTVLNCAAIVPAAAQTVSGALSVGNLAGEVFLGATPGTGTGGTGMIGLNWLGSSATSIAADFVAIPFVTPQQLYYYTTNSSTQCSISAYGYTF